MTTREMEAELKKRQLIEVSEINRDELKFLEQELARFRAWLILNQGNFTPAEKAEALRQARELVNELLANE